MSDDEAIPPVAVDHDLREIADLCDAIRDGNYAGVAELLDRSPVLARLLDEDGIPPLHHAVRTTHQAIVELLLDHGVGNSQITSALEICIREHNSEIALLLTGSLWRTMVDPAATPFGAPSSQGNSEPRRNTGAVADDRLNLAVLRTQQTAVLEGLETDGTSDHAGSRIQANIAAAWAPGWSSVLAREAPPSAPPSPGLDIPAAPFVGNEPFAADDAEVARQLVNSYSLPPAARLIDGADSIPSAAPEPRGEAGYFVGVVSRKRLAQSLGNDRVPGDPFDAGPARWPTFQNVVPNDSGAAQNTHGALMPPSSYRTGAPRPFPATPSTPASERPSARPSGDGPPRDVSLVTWSGPTEGSSVRGLELTVVGWCLDVGLVVLSAGDMILNFMVMVQFGIDKDYKALGLLLFGISVCFVLSTLFVLRRWGFAAHCGSLLLFGAVLVFSPLIPFVAWAWYSFHRWAGREVRDAPFCNFLRQSQRDHVHQHNTWLGESSLAGTSAVVLDGVSSWSSVVLGQLEAALPQHLRAHQFLCFDSLRSAVYGTILLAALSLYGHASITQVAAVTVALANISSKAYVVSRSFDARVFLFKYALVVHDVFSFAYGITVLFGPKSRTIVWIIMARYCGVFCVFAGLCGMLLMITDLSLPKFTALCSLVLIVNSVFASILADATKLSWMILCDVFSSANAQPADYPSHATALAFLRNGDFNDKVRHMLKKFLYDTLFHSRQHPLLFRTESGVSKFQVLYAFVRGNSSTFKLLRDSFPGEIDLRRVGEKKLNSYGVLTLGVVWAVVQLYGVAFPFLHVFIDGWGSLSTLQTIVFGVIAFALLCLAFLAPWLISYVRYRVVLACVGTIWAFHSTVLSCIEDYVHSSHTD